MGAFAGTLGSLWVEIGAKISKLEAGLADASSAIDKTIADSEKKFAGFEKLGDRLTGLGTGLTAAVTLPIAAIGTAAVKASGEFDSAMRLVSARGDITGKDLATLKAQAEDLGAKTQFSSKQAAEGMAEFAGAGFKTTEIYAAMPGTLNLAAAAQTSVGNSATVVKDLLGQFGLEANDTGKAVDVLAKASNEGSGTLLEMANSLQYVGPVARSSGMDIEQTSAALLVLDQAGIRGERAGTALRAMLASLAGPSTEAARYMDDLGIKVTDASGKMLPFSNVIEQFRTELGKIPNEAERANALVQIFGREALAAANILTTAGSPALLGFEERLRKSAGEAERTATVMNSGMGGALERMRGSIETAAQKLGDVLAPSLIQLASLIEQGANKIAEFAGWFQSLPQGVQTTAIAFTALAAAIGPALIIAGQFAQAVVAINTALPLASKGVTALTATIGVSAAGLAVWTAGITAAGAALAYTLKAAYDAKQAQHELAKANEGTASSLARLEKHLEDQGADLSQLQSELKRGQITQREYELGLRKIAEQIGKTKKATGEIKDETGDLEKAQKKITDAVAKASKSLGDQGKEAEKTAGEFKKLTPRYTEVTALAQKLEAEYRKHVNTVAELRLALQEGGAATVRMIQPTEQLTAAVSQVNVKLLEMPAALKAALDPFKDLNAAVNQVKSVEDAFSRLGVNSTASLNKQAEQARKDYETIKNSGTASARDIDAAWVKMEEARIAAARQAGREIPAETEAALAKVKASIETNTRDTRGSWDTWSKQVSTIVTDLGRDISNILFEGDKSWAEKGKAVLSSLGQAVMRSFVEPATAAISELITGAIADLIGGKGFGGVLDSIKNIGSTMKDVFGGASSNVPAVPTGGGGGSIPTGGGGSGGSGSGGGIGGVAGAVNLVSGVVSAVAGVVTAIGTVRLEGTMNAVEHNTRYAMMYLGERSDGGILGVMFRVGEYLQYVQPLLDGVNAKLNDWLEPLTGQLAHVVEAIPQLQRRLDEISHNTLWGSASDRDNTTLLTAMRDLLGTNRQPTITVTINGVSVPSTAIQLRTQGLI